MDHGTLLLSVAFSSFTTATLKLTVDDVLGNGNSTSTHFTQSLKVRSDDKR